MRQTTVRLPDDLDAQLRQDAQLRHEARRQGLTIAQVTRTALEGHLSGGWRLDAAASGHSGHNDVSKRVEEIVQESAESVRAS